jgi:hypothetical protein
MPAPDAPLVLVVCGGRHYSDEGAAFAALDKASPALVVNGQASGADSLASKWCHARGVPVLEVPALWESEGRAAGPKRNARMLRYAMTLADRLDEDEMRLGVCAFPGGRGTASMVKLATDAKCRVWRPAG